MPIRPENKARYPKDWPAISKRIRERAGNKCEGCGVPNGHYRNNTTGVVSPGHQYNASRIVLTVAHLDHTPENCADENLKAWCQRCHNSYDAPERAKGIKERRRAALGIGDLFDSVVKA